MANVRVARRYARAAFDIAVERGDLDGWLRDLRLISETLGQPNILLLLENPKLTADEKRRVVTQTLGGLDPLRVNLVFVLLANGRIEALPAVAAEFERLYNEYNNIAVATVTTAVPLTSDEARRVEAQLQRLTGKKIVLQHHVDPSILGGVIARIGDRLINGSLAERLASLRTEIVR